VAPRRGVDDLSAWAASRAPDLIARAEAEAIAVLRDALVDAATGRGAAPPEPRSATREPHAVAPPPEPDDEGALLWAYCVLREGDDLAADLRGVDGRGELERIVANGLSAVVSRVPRSEFGPEPLRRNLNDLTWLERTARAHEAVLESTLRQSTLVPLRMCTLYESEDSVRRMLTDRRDALLTALDGLDGRYEWAVKVIVDGERLMEAARATIAPEDPASAGRGEGGAYLLRRRADRAVREAADALRADIAERVHARLQDWAIDAVTRPAQNPELSGHRGDMVLNGAYLVERERTDDLHTLIEELEQHDRPLGVRIELSGPWPPYNFVGGED
jgi:gas vesicle protein GvpL/GvpF